MNHYLVKLNINTDLFESMATHLVKATHNGKAIQLAYLAEAHGDLTPTSGVTVHDEDSGRVFSVHSSKLVNPVDVSILKAYLVEGDTL